jgi:hypothetical protein
MKKTGNIENTRSMRRTEIEGMRETITRTTDGMSTGGYEEEH